jgi:hypothetical protein
MIDAARVSRVHLVLFVFSSALLAVFGWWEASQAQGAELTPVFGAVPLVHLVVAIGAHQRRAWANVGSKLTGGLFLARLRIHSI